MSLISSLQAYLQRAFGDSDPAPPTTTPATNTPPTSIPTSETPKSRYLLDDSTSDTLVLPDGRKLGYAQYGRLTGHAILYVHGIPGSRLEAARFHDLGLDLGIRIIAADRPGIGLSEPQTDRTLLGHAKDLEALVRHLGVDEYSVLVS
jgi:hypothetical protein